MAFVGTCVVAEHAETGLLLMQWRVSEKWFEFPGGKLNTGELPIQAAQREFTEETGINTCDMTPLVHIGVLRHLGRQGSEEWDNYIYKCRFWGTPYLMEPDKVSGFGLFNPSDMPYNAMWDSAIKVFQKYYVNAVGV